jgi:hypothetical protein
MSDLGDYVKYIKLSFKINGNSCIQYDNITVPIFITVFD